MIIYKRELNADDLKNLNDGEELIYYKSDEVAMTISIIMDENFLVRIKRISDNKLIEEVILKTIEEVMEFI